VAVGRHPDPRKFRYKRTIHRACLHTGASVAADSVATMRAAGKPITWGRPEDSPHVLYRMFNRDGVLLYVGITNNPKGRFRTHGELKSWWSEVATITLQHLPSRLHLEAAESDAIKNEGPLYNIARTAGAYVPRPKCPSCGSPEPDLMPDDYELLDEDGRLVPFCTDPFHFPGDERAAEKLHQNRDLLRQAGLLRLSALAEERLKRRREAMERLGDMLDLNTILANYKPKDSTPTTPQP
jgi:predicted GIY-YIG superfamily endonuclease